MAVSRKSNCPCLSGGRSCYFFVRFAEPENNGGFGCDSGVASLCLCGHSVVTPSGMNRLDAIPKNEPITDRVTQEANQAGT